MGKETDSFDQLHVDATEALFSGASFFENPKPLLDHLQKEQEHLQAIDSFIAKYLRLQPEAKQEQYLSQYCRKLHFAHSDELVKYYLSLVNGSCFSNPYPTDIKSENLLLRLLASRHLRALGQPALPIIDITYNPARIFDFKTYEEITFSYLQKVIQDLHEGTDFLSDYTAASSAENMVNVRDLPIPQRENRLISYAAVTLAGRCAKWIILQDELAKVGYDKGNPFEPLVQMCMFGYFPAGRRVKKLPGKKPLETFIVFSPQKLMVQEEKPFSLSL